MGVSNPFALAKLVACSRNKVGGQFMAVKKSEKKFKGVRSQHVMDRESYMKSRPDVLKQLSRAVPFRRAAATPTARQGRPAN
jgi:hypothetical protein